MKTFLLSLALAGALFAQQTAPVCNSATVPLCTMGAPAGAVQVKPQAVPTSTTTVTSADAHLQVLTISNATGGAITVTVADKQASPISVLGAVSIAANTTYVIVWPEGKEYWCPGGFTITSSGSGLTWSGKWKQ